MLKKMTHFGLIRNEKEIELFKLGKTRLNSWEKINKVLNIW